MEYEIYKGVSKKGKDYEALRIKIGEYNTMIFPNKIEMLYIKTYLRKNAHRDFKGDDLDVDSGEV